MLLGSFDWIAKQHNLERFLCEVGARLAGADVGVDVVGNVASRLRQKLERVYSNVRFWGVVDDVLPCANQVRCAVIPECLGGGLKLKLLDYAFMRLPIFGLAEALAGTTDEERSALFVASTLEEMTNQILSYIDNLSELDRKQATAFEVFSSRLDDDNRTGERLTRVFAAN